MNTGRVPVDSSVRRQSSARQWWGLAVAAMLAMGALAISSVGGNAPAVRADAGVVDHFGVAVSGPIQAGAGFTVTVTAQDSANATVATYPGGATLSGLANSPGCSTCMPDLVVRSATYGGDTWTGGVGTFTGVIAYNAQTAATVTASDGTLTGTSAPFDVSDAETLGGFSFDTSIGTQVAGTAIPDFAITASDPYGNIDTGYSGGTLSGLSDSPGCADCSTPISPASADEGSATWTDGVGTFTGVTAVNAQTNASVTITDGSVSNDSAGFTVKHSTVEGGITIDPISTPQTAGGSGIAVTVRAFDEFGNVNTDASGGTLSGLAPASPGCSGCNPGVAVANPTYPSLSWASGVGSASVNAVVATAGEKIHAVVGSHGNTSNAFTVNHSDTEGGITIDPVGTQTAGLPGFTVTVRAFDEYGNVNTDASGGTLSGLAASLGCSGCSPSFGSVPATYTAIGWSSGVGTSTVKAVKAQNGASIHAVVGTKSNDSAGFTVAPAVLSQLAFSDTSQNFNGQPIDTKFSQPIDSVCGPYIPAQPTAANPCAPATSTPTKVLAVDSFGNRVSGVGITISSSPTGVGGTLAGTTVGGADPTIAPYGEATFSNLAIMPTGAYTLKATAGAVNRTSATFNIVSDLAACDNQLCTNNGNNGGNSNSIQRAYGRIRTGATNDFYVPGTTNVLLTTKFAPATGTDGPNAKCGSNQTIGQATDLQIGGTGFSITSKTTMVFITPKDTLKADGVVSRGTPSFNICLGASVLSGNPAPWTQKSGQPSVHIGDRFWGTPPDCTTALLNSGNPCIGLRSKQAAPVQSYLGLNNTDFAKLGISDADLVLIVELGYPWDSKGGTY